MCIGASVGNRWKRTNGTSELGRDQMAACSVC